MKKSRREEKGARRETFSPLERIAKANWLPLEQMGDFCTMVQAQLQDTREMHGVLQAEEGPVLDRLTVKRIEKLYRERQEWIHISREQIARWRKVGPSTEQQTRIQDVERMLGEDERLVGEILKRNAGIPKIEDIQEMSDLEAGIRFLTGELPLPKSLRSRQTPEPAGTAKSASPKREKLLEGIWELIRREVAELLRHHLMGAVKNPEGSSVIVDPIRDHVRILVEEMTDDQLGAFVEDLGKSQDVRDELLVELETSIMFSAGLLRRQMGR